MRAFFFALSLALGLNAHAQPLPRIVVGTVYNVFHEEYATDEAFFAQVDADFAKMKAAGITDVMLFPMSQWNTETKDLLWTRTDHMVRTIERLGLHFVPLMLKEEQNSHYFPIWAFDEYPDLKAAHTSSGGNRNTRENVDFADPRVMAYVDRYFREVVGRYGTSPALSFYNVWNEPHYRSSSDLTVRKFRTWLERKYGTLAELRRVWGEDYTSWEQVTPFLNDNWNSSMPHIDWTLFMNDLNGELLRELIEVLHRYDRSKPVNANPVGEPLAGFGEYGGYNRDNWPLAQYGDFHGFSYYPDGWERGNGLTPYPHWLHALTFTAIRSAAMPKPYLVTELFTHAQNGLALNGYQTAESIRYLAWTSFANNSKGMIYWKWEPFMRGRQSLGRGLVGIDGELRPGGEAVRDIAAVMARHGDDVLRATLRPAKAAILVDMVGLLKTLEQPTEAATRQFMFESQAGVFKALHEANITADVIRADRGLTLDDLRRYRIIYLPFQIVVRRDVAAMLTQFVNDGGWVVADARTATLDELDFAYRTSPGAGLDTLFGATRRDWVAKKGGYAVRLRDGTLFDGKYFRDDLRVSEGVEVVGRFVDNNDPALIERPVGRGRAILSAVPLGASVHGQPENDAKRVIIDAARRAGATPEATFTTEDGRFVDVKLHDGPGYSLIYLVNPHMTDVRGALSLADGRPLSGALDIVSGASLRDARRIIVPAQSAVVIRIAR